MTLKVAWQSGEYLDADPLAGIVVTHFSPSHFTGGAVVSADHEHAENLGIFPFQHRLAHELAHSLVAKAIGYDQCPILRAAAYQEPMLQDAEKLEWYYSAVTYLAFGAKMRQADYWGAIWTLERNFKADARQVSARLRWLVDGLNMGQVEITL
jgi:hypothetical protein